MNQTLRNRVRFLSVLRHRDYRRYYLGLLASVSAHQGMIAAQGVLVYEITGLAAALGFVAAAQAVPGLVLNLFAGALADRIDPRRMIMFGEGAAALLMVILAGLVITDTVVLWHVIVLSFFVGVAISFDQPARRTIWPVLIPRAEMLYATSLNQTVWNGTRVTAPAIATGIIGIVHAMTGSIALGYTVSFLVIAAGFFTMVVAMLFVRMPAIERAKGANILQDIVDGLVFSFQNRIFLVLLGMGFLIGYFGLSYMWLLPAYVAEELGADQWAVGTLMSANGAGGLVGVLAVASFGAYQNRSWLLIGGAVSFGVIVMAIGFAGPTGLLVVAVLAALAGALYSLFQVAAGTVLNLLVPHEYRGRVMGLRGVMWSLAPLGALQSGLIATWFGTPVAIALGGVVVIIVSIAVFVMSRHVRRLRQLADQAETVRWHRRDRGVEAAVTSQRPV